jgi:TetR/AcrR family transcriptional regulator, transcriptional repressor for nem operon
MNTATDADDGNLTLRELAREALDAWKRRLMDVIEAGIRAGEFAHSLDKERLANVIIATLEGALMITRIEHSRQALHDAQAYLESHIAGL